MSVLGVKGIIRIRKLPRKSRKKNSGNQAKVHSSQDTPLSGEIEQNIALFSSAFRESPDIIIRKIHTDKLLAAVIYVEGLCDTKKLDEFVLGALISLQEIEETDLLTFIENHLAISKTEHLSKLSDGVNAILLGKPLLLINGCQEALALGLTQFEKRSIEEPKAETSIRGPREGFTETLSTNVSLIRRIIRDPALKIKKLQIGKYTKTDVLICYVEGLVDHTLIEEIENRLKRIDIDGVYESGYLEQFIEDNPYSPFPQVLYTERPDVLCANLLEGRAAILMDGTPFALIAPVSFFSLFQSQEDYYERFWIGTFIRLLRFLFLVISLFLPSTYVAITTFHQEMVPTSLLLNIASAREGVAFPAIVEVFIMELSFEALREAGIRLPRQVGSAVSIVGALVIGEAAVQAGIVSAPMIIVVSITGIASFMVPRYSVGLAIRILRFPIILLGGILGLIGVMLGFILIIIHLCGLRSFGIPYLSPISTLQKNLYRDSLIRAPLWKMNERPHFTGNFNKTRQSEDLKPDPNKGGEEG